MKIYDPLYGSFELPSFLERLVLAPEVRRLMGVRLLNAPTPTMPTLSEIRRFSHTLGVLRLALLNPLVGFSKDELKAFTAAILIHDAATPPFAHLLEYYLRDRDGWNHESALPGLLTGHQFASNSAYQILPSEELKFERICSQSKIDFGLVLEIVRKRHPASRLLFGTLDFDNLDNVLRMAWALGQQTNAAHFLDLAKAISVSINGELLLPEDMCATLETWAKTRNAVYQILVFDHTTVATQAVLTKAIRTLFSEQDISENEWAKRDDDLIETLVEAPQTKELMLRYFNTSLPQNIITIQMPGSLKELGFASRDEAIDFVEEIAANQFDVRHPFGYVLADKGSFSKKVDCVDPSTRKRWSMGTTSSSVVFYCFAPYAPENIKKPFGSLLLATLQKRLSRSVSAH